jgi:hypothetical protein
MNLRANTTVRFGSSVALLLFSSSPIVAQNLPNRSLPQQSTEVQRLGKPVNWGALRMHLFTDTQMTMTFTMATSWIPGPDHQGMFRYRILAEPELPSSKVEQFSHPEMYSIEGIEKFVERVHDCTIFVELLDSDQFKLRSIPVTFQEAVDEGAVLKGLTANSSEQMDANEYRSFLGTESASGSWLVSWTCPEKP